MRILAIDPGSKLGWSFYDGNRTESGVQMFSLRRGESQGMRFLRFNNWLSKMIGLTNPDLICFEMAHMRGGYATEALIGITTRIQEQCARANIASTSIHSGTLKKFATGRGNASKEEMIEAAKKRFPDQKIESDDQADALMTLAYAMEEFDSGGK